MPVLPYVDHHPSVAEDVFLAPTAYVVGRVTIGARCSLWWNSTVRGDTGPITIGEEVNVQEGCTIHTEADVPAVIGNHVTMGHHALIHSAIIEDDVLIGMNASVLSGARVGRGSIIAAHALVPEGREIPPGSLVMGVPGRVVRQVTEAEAARARRNGDNYLRLAREYRRAGIGLP